MSIYKRHRFPPDIISCQLARKSIHLFALQNEPAVKTYLSDRSIDLGFLAGQAIVQIPA